ncbi:restriction modification system DNA specificity domain protein [Cellulophaga algicola DSM 14237]|uniref:Restriction modification system DNA specificity domain protein n=1 Tax=Cellulophaga algicola (strain DSM 14237 / IC166 / ACAM 630) TaxID=688270 RepID=E6X956_CELAD|nr:restriction endonuclease subunit S [Cellulophaga algicola]ADV50866.1 restriction modification system DNA specificity domain protein [Cellulophaga algicola DSM 14237]
MKLLQHFKELTIRPKNAKELKGLILQLAIQGKLTANWRKENPDIEPANELLKEIKKERTKLIKEKKIKKEKSLPKISKDEIPYELPDSWVWCRLNDICEYIQRGKSPKYTEIPKIPVISQKCVQWSGFDISRARFITEESLEKYVEERFLQKGDLLWNSTGDGTIGRVISYPGTNYEKVVADSHVTVVRGFKNFIITEYLWIFTASPLIQELVVGRVTGSTKQTELGTGTVKSMEFSFPPLEEQKEIVKVVETLFKEVEQLEQLTVERINLKEDFVTSALHQLTTNNANQEWTFLQDHFKSFFNETTNIKKLRETVLQLAVQGKLTADWRVNNPDTEDASQLLKRLQEEKAQLIKDKKIKKEKALPKITKEEIPYELPEGWVWCRMIELCQYITDGTHQTPKYTEEGRMFLSAKNVKPFKFMPEKHRFVSEEDFEGYRRNRKPELNDILLTRVGAGIGEATLIDQDLEFAIYVSVGLLKMFPNKLEPNYIVMWLNSPEGRQYSSKNTYGKGVSQGNLNLSLIRQFVVSLPPIEEQKAIVEKVNALMGLCDTLEHEVQQSQEYSEMLMQSVLREVFEGKERKVEI